LEEIYVAKYPVVIYSYEGMEMNGVKSDGKV